MDEPLIGVHSLADASGKPAGGGPHHRPLHRMSRKPSQQGSSHHSNPATHEGTFDSLVAYPAGLVSQAFAFIQILTNMVGTRIAIRINRRPVPAMSGTTGNHQSHN